MITNHLQYDQQENQRQVADRRFVSAMTAAIFCPHCDALILAAMRCSSCGRWERLSVSAQTGTRLLWQAALGTTLSSGMTLAGQMLYVMDGNGALNALDAATGQLVWPTPVSLGHWRVHQQMAAAGGLLIIGPTDQESLPEPDKAVLALDVNTGQEIWRQPLGARQISDPLATSEAVYVATSDGFAVSLNLRNGAVRWRQPIQGVFQAAPALALSGALVLFGGDRGVLTALAADDGRQVWTFQAVDDGDWHADLRYSPVVSGDTVYATCWNRRCYALDAATGELRWASAAMVKRPAVTPPLVTEDALYFCGHDRYVYCLDRATGQRRWAVQFSRMSETTPLLIDGLLYVAVQDRRVYALDPASGVVQGEPVLEMADKVEKAWASDGQRIFLGDRGGHLYGLQIRLAPEVADPLLLEQQGCWVDAAALHALSGNLVRAGQIYSQQLAEPTKAAQLFEAGGALDLAAEQYVTAGDLKAGRRLYRELSHWLEVAQLAEQLGDWLEAAQGYEAAGQWADAGRLYERLRAWPQAGNALEQAGNAAQEAGDLAGARAWWARAGNAYRAAVQPEKAVQLYKSADQADEAQKVVSTLTDMKLARQLQRFLLGSQRLARLLAEEGQVRAAAEEYLLAGQPLEAARMYETAGEYALASQHFQAQGFLLDAARTLARAGDHNAAAELYWQGGDLLQAAQAYARALNHHKAAQAFEQVAAWAEAASQWQALESWERAAAAWEKAGQSVDAALAWERAGELLRAAECYCQVAEETEQAGANDKETAVLYERAMQAYARCGAQRRADYCDRKRRFLRKQPWLEAKVAPATDLVVDVRGKLVITVANSGWGDAENVLVRATALSGNEPVHSHAREFGLGRGLSKPQDLYVIPYHPGQLAVDVVISYQDIYGNDYPLLEQTVDLDVKDKDAPKGATPAEIHVHGHYFAGQVHEVISDGIKIERHAASSPGLPVAQSLAVPTLECARCGHQQRADAVICSQCQTPFAQCRHCGLSLPRRMKHCMHCGKPL